MVNGAHDPFSSHEVSEEFGGFVGGVRFRGEDNVFADIWMIGIGLSGARAVVARFARLERTRSGVLCLTAGMTTYTGI